MLTEEALLAVTQRTVSRVPDWLRSDLLSKDVKARAGAEETLAKIISAALLDANEPEAANDAD